MKRILHNKKGLALESAIIFLVTIFTFCFLLSTLAIINSNQLRIEKIYTNNDYEVEQIGEYFLSYVNKAEVTTETTKLNICPSPTISISGKEVTISCSLDGAKIYYTLDGSSPSVASTEYTAPFTVEASCTVSAIAVCDGYLTSETASEKVTIDNGEGGETPVASLEPEDIRTVDLVLSPLSETQPAEDTWVTECKSFLETKYGTEKYLFDVSRSQVSATMTFELKVYMQQSGELVLHIRATKTAYVDTTCTVNIWDQN